MTHEPCPCGDGHVQTVSAETMRALRLNDGSGDWLYRPDHFGPNDEWRVGEPRIDTAHACADEAAP